MTFHLCHDRLRHNFGSMLEMQFVIFGQKTKVFQEILDSINNARANPSKIGETSMKALKLMYGVQIILQ